MKTINKLTKIVLAVMLSIGVIGMEGFTKISAASILDPDGGTTLNGNISVTTAGSADLKDATVYLANSPSVPFDASASTHQGYEESFSATISNGTVKKITFSQKIAPSTTFIVIVATDVNNVKYVSAGRDSMSWNGTNWTATSGQMYMAGLDTSTIEVTEDNSEQFYPNVIMESELDITYSGTTYEYTGSEITPKPTIALKANSPYNSTGKEIELVEGTDYTLAYTNNTNVGNNTASINITMKGAYVGTASQNFSITAKAVDATDIIVNMNKASYTYTGTPVTLDYTVKVGDKTLVEGVDYDLSPAAELTALGDYSLDIVLKGNYAGTGSGKLKYTIADTTTEPFLTAYLGGKDNPFDEVTEDNYATILTGNDDYENLTTAQKDEINKKIAPATYPDLLKKAQEMKDALKDKDDAKKKIDEIVKTKEEEIDALTGISSEEKTRLKEDVKKLVDPAKNAIDVSTSGSEDITKKFEEDVDKLVDKAVKTSAKAKIDEHAKEVKEALDKMNLSEDEKSELVKDLENRVATAKKAIDDATDLTTIDKLVTDGKTDISDVEDKAIAKEFANKYLRAKLGDKVYNEVVTGNVDQIISGGDAYDKLSPSQINYLNDIISSESDYSNYDDYVQDVEKLIEESAIKFISDHLIDANKELVKSATRDTFDMILGGEEDWNKLSDTEKLAINLSLQELGAKQSYDEMLEAAKASVKESSDSFIKKYVSDETGSIYKTVTRSNYEQILSGKDDWNKLLQCEKDAINATLTENGGKTYEELLKLAEQVKAEVDAEKEKADAEDVKTGDHSDMTLWMGMLGLSAGALLLAEKKRRKI